MLFIPPAEEISIVNFRKVPNSGKADANTISFAFEVDPSINYGGPLTYDIEFHWEEELRCYSGSSSSYYYRARDYYSRTCQEHGNLRRKGQTYQFSVSKRGLGSGPLYVNVSVSLLCNSSYSSSYYYYYYYCYSSCQRWQFKGQSYTIKTDTIHGVYMHMVELSLLAYNFGVYMRYCTYLTVKWGWLCMLFNGAVTLCIYSWAASH